MRKSFVILAEGLIIILICCCNRGKRQASQRMTQTHSVLVHQKVSL